MKYVVAFVSASLFNLFAASAVAQLLPAPPLTGESFHDSAPTITSVTCDSAGFFTGGSFEASGTALGPYPGTFQQAGTLDTFGNFTASFTIDSSVGQVSGTTHSSFLGVGYRCDETFLSTATVGPEPLPGDTYDATIVTASGAFADNGLYQFSFLRDSLPSDTHFDESFQSAVAPPPPLFPTFKAQCKDDGWRNFPQFANQGQCVRFVETDK